MCETYCTSSDRLVLLVIEGEFHASFGIDDEAGTFHPNLLRVVPRLAAAFGGLLLVAGLLHIHCYEFDYLLAYSALQWSGPSVDVMGELAS